MDTYRGPSRRSPPPRDRAAMRDRDRDRDDHPNVEYFGKGESYRPGGSTGEPYRPNRDRFGPDSWNSERRDDRRDDRRREDIDSYIPPTSSRAQRPRSRSPGGYRRRSRSPIVRGRDREDLFPEPTRTRSPPPRRFSPRRDERTRSPLPRRRSRSPFAPRVRSPDGKRLRDYSPDGRRSPKRERLSSPRSRYDRPRSPPRRGYSPLPPPPRDGDRNTYRPRSRTPPPRDDRRGPYNDDNWRRRSPSPRMSGPASNATSRRSSPPVYAERDRIGPPGSRPRSPAYSARNDMAYRGRSPRRDYDRSRDPSPPLPVFDRDRDRERERERSEPIAVGPPTGPANYRNGSSYERPPPTGPSRGYNAPQPQASPPSGPAAAQPSMSAHNRTTGPAISATSATGNVAVPTRPRGAPAGPNRFEAPPRDYSNPALRGRSSLTYRAPGLRTPSYTSDNSGPPSGPRASFGSSAPPARGDFSSGSGRGDFGGGARGDFNNARGGYSSFSTSFRGSSNSTSTTYPRTQRFHATSASPVTPTGPAAMSSISPVVSSTERHLSTLAQIVPGGRKLPSDLPPEQERRIKVLEVEAEKIRKEIDDKQRVKRRAINEWEVLERQSNIEGLKSELAEGALRKLMESDAEGATGMAF